MAKKSENSLGQTYDTLQGTVVQGDVQWLQNAVNQGGPGWSNLLLVGLVVIVILAGIVETGTFFGIILPSDIILSASVLALVSLGKRWMVVLITLLSIIFTIVGDQLGYYTGFKLGSSLYDRPDTRYFKKKYLLQAQEALQTWGEKFLYVGRYVGFGGILPTIYGMMKWERAKFLKVSVLSAIMWKLSIIVPLILLILIFPSLKSRYALLLILAAAVPEIIWWIMLLKPQAEKYFERISAAKQEISAIRESFNTIGQSVGDIRSKVKKPTDDALASQELPGVWIEEKTIQEVSHDLLQDPTREKETVSDYIEPVENILKPLPPHS